VKAVGGILSGIVLALLLVLVISTITYLMNVAYDQQLTQESYVNDFISSPKAFQVGSSTIVSNGLLDIKYVIYPNGKVDDLSQPFDGRVDISSLLNGWPWAYVVLSNGQTFNISQPQSGTSSTISLLSLESQVPYYAGFPLNVWNGSTYDRIINEGLSVNPADYPTILQNGETIAWHAFGRGTVAVVPVHTGNGWLNFTAIVENFPNCGIGIMLENGTNGTGDWLAIPVGVNGGTASIGSNVTYGLYEASISEFYPYYNFTPFYNFTSDYTLPPYEYTPYGAEYYNYTLRVAIHFQEGEPAELYIWWLNGSQWVPVSKMYTWAPNASNQVAITYETDYLGHVYVNGTWNLKTHTWPPYINYSLVTISFPAYVYSIYVTYNFGYAGVVPAEYKYYHLAPINLVPGSNVIIIPGTYADDGAYDNFVYNITSTI